MQILTTSGREIRREFDKQYLKSVSHAGHPAARYGTDQRVGKRQPGGGMPEVVVGARVYRVRDGGQTGGHPDRDDHTHGPRQTGRGLGAQRVTDGQVPLDRERGDGQDGRRRRHLGEERLEEAVRLAEAPRIRLEDRVQLRRQSCRATVPALRMIPPPF